MLASKSNDTGSGVEVFDVLVVVIILAGPVVDEVVVVVVVVVPVDAPAVPELNNPE